jgi:hypothetical protein
MDISNLSFLDLVKLKYEVEKRIIEEYVEEIKTGEPDNKLLRDEIRDGAKDIDDNDEAYILSYTSTEPELRWRKFELIDDLICDMCEQKKYRLDYQSILMSDILICTDCYESEKLQDFEMKIFGNLEELKKAERIVKLEDEKNDDE